MSPIDEEIAALEHASNDYNNYGGDADEEAQRHRRIEELRLIQREIRWQLEACAEKGRD